MSRSIIGFHYSMRGNKDGIGDFMRQLNSAGIPFLMKGADDAGLCFEGQTVGREKGVANHLIYRVSTAGQNNGYDYDVPDYKKSPYDAAVEHFFKTAEKWPPELDKSIVWMEPINEPRAKASPDDVQYQNMHPTDWLGEFMVEYAKIANQAGYKVCGPSFNSGEPEVFVRNDYEKPGMLAYLRYCAAKPNQAALSLHEYTWDREQSGEQWADWYPHLWGRVEAAMAAADRHGISRDFSIFVTEWGFAPRHAPRWPGCKPHLTAYNQWAARWPQIKGVAAWSLQGGWGSVDNDLQSWIGPLADYAVNMVFDPGPQPAQTHARFGGTMPGVGQAAVSQPTGHKDSAQPPARPSLTIDENTPVLKIKQVNAPAGLWLRSGPSTGHEKLQLMADGTAVEVLQEGEWDLIRVGDKTGYSSSRYLTAGNTFREQAGGATAVPTGPAAMTTAAPTAVSGQYTGPNVAFAAGIHGPGDAFTWHDPGFRDMMSRLNLPVKFMSDGDRANFYNQFRKPELDLVRVFWSPDRSRKKSAREAWDEDIRDGVLRFYSQGARDFEVHNEPRLGKEGLGHQWHNGAEFGAFLRQLMLIIKENCPQARLWYPGESPGVPWTDQFAFSGPAYQQVADLCYGICQHAYTGTTSDAGKAVKEIVDQVKAFRLGFGDWQKPIIISECSVNRAATPDFRAKVYTQVANELRQVPGVKGVFWYISHWNAPENERANAESWFGTNLPDLYK